MKISKELLKYKLHLEGISEVRWNRDGTKPVDEYTIFYTNGNKNNELSTGSFVYKRIMSVVKFVSGMSYITLRGRRCDATVLNVHAPTEDNVKGII
jgi:hypothetical protein